MQKIQIKKQKDGKIIVAEEYNVGDIVQAKKHIMSEENGRIVKKNRPGQIVDGIIRNGSLYFVIQFGGTVVTILSRDRHKYINFAPQPKPKEEVKPDMNINPI